MGKYAELSSEGVVPYVLWFHFSDTTSKGVAVSVSDVDLMERVCHLTNKIYREILCKSSLRQSGHETKIITIHGLDCEPENTQITGVRERIVLSLDLLAWISMEGRILCSFTNFITTPEFSDSLYISPGVYHSQITEYSLQKINT